MRLTRARSRRRRERARKMRWAKGTHRNPETGVIVRLGPGARCLLRKKDGAETSRSGPITVTPLARGVLARVNDKRRVNSVRVRPRTENTLAANLVGSHSDIGTRKAMT